MGITLEKLKKAEIKNISFEDIFLSASYKDDLMGMMQSACMRVNFTRAIHLHVFFDEDNDDIGYTDGNTIHVNLGCNFASRLRKKPVLFHILIVGIIAHELGHVLWTEFDDGMLFLKSIEAGVLYPSVPSHPNAQKYVEALKNPAYRRLFCDVCHSLDNILEDIFVNAMQAKMLGGLYSKGINLGNIMIVEEMDSINTQKEKNFWDFSIILNCLIEQLKGDSVIYGKYEDEYKDVVSQIAKIANDYIYKPTHKERTEGINLIICELWEYIEPILEKINNQATQSSQNSGSGDYSQSSASSNSQSQSSNSSSAGSSGGSKVLCSGGSCSGESDSNDSPSDGNMLSSDDSEQSSGVASDGEQESGDSSEENGLDKQNSSGLNSGTESNDSQSKDKQPESNKNGQNTSADKDTKSSEQYGNSQCSKESDSKSGEASEKQSKSEESTSNDGEKKDSSPSNKSDSTNGNNSSDGTIDEETLNRIVEKVVQQLQGKTKESHNQEQSSLAGKNTIQLNPSIDSSLNEELHEKSETGRFAESVGEAIAAEGTGKTTLEKSFTPERVEAVARLQEILDKISTERAEKANESIVKSQIVQSVQAMDFGPLHSKVNKHILRVSGNSKEAKRQYHLLLNHVSPIVDKLEKVIRRTIKEENLTGERRGRYYGKLLDTSRLYRPDVKVFKDRKNPKKEIDCAFYILVDVSGSMYGKKIAMSQLVSILFAEVCDKLDIPLEITGHTTGNGGIVLYNFISYDSCNRSDKYSLSYMKDEYSNRDGAAIIYACERLLKRPEKKKMFCIISDGQPADMDYYGETAKQDMKHLKNKYSKDGITFVAAAIDSDKEFIKEIYGKNFLNISFLESMPKTFGKILQNAVLND